MAPISNLRKVCDDAPLQLCHHLLGIFIVLRGKCQRKLILVSCKALQDSINLSTFFSYIVVIRDETGIFAVPLVLFTIRLCGNTQTLYVTEAWIAAV